MEAAREIVVGVISDSRRSNVYQLLRRDQGYLRIGPLSLIAIIFGSEQVRNYRLPYSALVKIDAIDWLGMLCTRNDIW